MHSSRWEEWLGDVKSINFSSRCGVAIDKDSDEEEDTHKKAIKSDDWPISKRIGIAV